MSMNTVLIFLQDEFNFFVWCEEVELWNTLLICNNDNVDNRFFCCIVNDSFLMCLVIVKHPPHTLPGMSYIQLRTFETDLIKFPEKSCLQNFTVEML
jgi:hypothetical protein